ncbi:hypothetical protein Ddc_13262 [Ditylenchus destructor]|nr:hypothetical protein Ddc_13262 [Ditylenchus destructor]
MLRGQLKLVLIPYFWDLIDVSLCYPKKGTKRVGAVDSNAGDKFYHTTAFYVLFPVICIVLMGACLASLKFCVTPEFSSRGLRFKSKRRRNPRLGPRFGDPGLKLRTPEEVLRDAKIRDAKDDDRVLLDQQSARISKPSRNETIVNVDPTRIGWKYGSPKGKNVDPVKIGWKDARRESPNAKNEFSIY